MADYLRAMETAVTFIEAHLAEAITLADVAAAVSYSFHHFCRIFNQIAHHPPYDYLIRRRLTLAARQLVETDARITDLACTYHFGSPEGFSRAFRRMFGKLPTQWRRQGIRDPRVLMQPLTPAHLAQRSDPAFRRPALVAQSELTLVGLMTLAADDTAVSRLRRRLPHPATHVVTHYPDFWHKHGRLVLVGRLGETAVPPLVTQTLPPRQYAAFALPPRAAERPLLSDYIYQTWLPQSGYALAAPLEVELDGQLLVPLAA